MSVEDLAAIQAGQNPEAGSQGAQPAEENAQGEGSKNTEEGEGGDNPQNPNPENLAVNTPSAQDLETRFYELAAKAEIDPKFSLAAEDQAAFEKWLEEGGTIEMQKLNDLIAKVKAGELDLDNLGKVEQGESKETPTEPEPENDPIKLAMAEVGAKSIGELAEKIKGLKSSRDKTGSELGQKVKNLEALIYDLAEGKQEAIEHLKKNGVQVKLAAQQPNQDLDDDLDLDDDFDFETPREKQLREELEALKAKEEQREREIQEQRQAQRAQSDLVNIWTDFAADLVPSGKTPTQMLQLFEEWRDQAPEEPTHPDLQATIDVIEYARENGIGTLKAAVKAYLFERMPNKLLEAKAKGRQEVLNAPRSVGLSSKRESASTEIWTNKDIEMMEKNQKEIPKGWFEADGYTPTKQMPEIVRKHLGL